jgi:hypothetical protein
MGFLIDRALVINNRASKILHFRFSIFRIRKEVSMMKARYEKPRMVIETVVLATLAGDYNHEEEPVPQPE